MKTCKRCGKVKTKESFGISRNAKDGKQAYCITCQREYGDERTARLKAEKLKAKETETKTVCTGMGKLEKQARLNYLNTKAERYPAEMEDLLEKEDVSLKRLFEIAGKKELLESVYIKITDEITKLGG